MYVPDLIRVKRDRGELSADQIEALVGGIADGSVSDAHEQLGAQRDRHLAQALVAPRAGEMIDRLANFDGGGAAEHAVHVREDRGRGKAVAGGHLHDRARQHLGLLAIRQKGAGADLHVQRFAAMVRELGGPADLLEAPAKHLPTAAVTVAAEPAEAGIVSAVDVRAVGLAVVALGGGRVREDDPVDHSVGLTDVAAPGEEVAPGGRPLALVHAKDDEGARRATEALRAAYTLSDRAPKAVPPVLEILR